MFRSFQRFRFVAVPGSRATAAGWVVLIGVLMLSVAGRCAAQPADGPQIRGSAAGSGLGQMAPHRWAMVQAGVGNPTGSDAEFRLVWWFAEQPNYQFVRTVWVPAGMSRRIAWPVRYDGPAPKQTSGVDGSLRLMSDKQDHELASSPSLILYADQAWQTAFLSSDDDAPIDAVSAMRMNVGLDKRMMYPPDPSANLPRTVLGWQAAQIVVFARGDLPLDSAQRSAMRQWVRSGGSVWIMLDRMDVATLHQYFGSDAPLTEVDRLSLTQAHLQAVESQQSRPSEHPLFDGPVTSEKPMPFVRVLADPADGWRTILRQGDWPAAIERNVGSGRLIVTTIDCRAWIAPGKAKDPQPTTAGRALAQAVFVQQTIGSAVASPAWLDNTATTRFVSDWIGYRVAGRSVIAAVLGADLVLFLLIGLILWRRGRAEQAVLVGLALAAASSAVLLAVGYLQRGKVQPTDAAIQVIDARPGIDTAQLRGRMMLFAPFSRPVPLHSDAGGWAWPTGKSDGAIRRLVYTDIDQWNWQELRVPGGAKLAMDFQTRVTLDKPLTLRWTLDDEGLAAHAPAGAVQPAQWQDMVLLTERAACAVQRRTESDGSVTLRISPDSELPQGNYVASGVLTQTQHQRNSVLNAAMEQMRPAEPTLLGWGPMLDDGLRDEPDVQRRGTALWKIPVQLEPVEAGRRVVVPWPLVKLQPVRSGGGGFTSSVMYDERNRQFMAISMPGAFVGGFEIPPQVGSLKLDGATLVMNITAIGRPVKILNVDGGRRTEVAHLDSPDGNFRLPLPADRLTVRDGKITLAIDVGDLKSTQSIESQSAMWQIHQLGLQVQGEVISPASH